MKTTTSLWIQYRHAKPQARLRLFCFPYAGGGASLFRSWSEKLPEVIEVCPVQLPGRENRLLEEPISQFSQLIEPLMHALTPYLDMPYVFFGHSMGALICFELARHLRRVEYQVEPLYLFVSGHSAPHVPDTDPPISHLSDPDFVKELSRLKGTPEEVLQNAELVQVLLPLLRADFSSCETYLYHWEEPLACPISAFGGLEDDEVPHDGIAAWGEHTTNTFKMRLFAGGHFFLNEALPSLLQAISQDLYSVLF